MHKVPLTNSSIPSTVYGGGQWDHLPLDTTGKTIGNTGTEELRRFLHKFGVAESHTAPRDIICSRYAALLKQIGGAASDKAITDFLEKHSVAD